LFVIELTFSEADADADRGEDETKGGDDDEQDAPDAQPHEDVGDVARSVLVGSGSGLVLGQRRDGVPVDEKLEIISD
jgi:hypothetical protein